MKETLRSEWVKCGKGCGGCPHGPYWYAYWRADGKVHKRYIGKGKPEEEPAPPPEPPNAWDDIFDDRKANARLAFTIMGLPWGADLATVKRQYRATVRTCHPDSNGTGDDMHFKRLSAAFSYLCRYLRA